VGRCDLVLILCLATVGYVTGAEVALRAVPDGTGQRVFIDPEGTVRLGPFATAGDFVHGHALVGGGDGDRRFIDARGAPVLDQAAFEAELVGPFDGELLGVRRADGSYACIDRSGRVIVDGLASAPRLEARPAAA